MSAKPFLLWEVTLTGPRINTWIALVAYGPILSVSQTGFNLALPLFQDALHVPSLS
jgi:hypothetical protein